MIALPCVWELGTTGFPPWNSSALVGSEGPVVIAERRMTPSAGAVRLSQPSGGRIGDWERMIAGRCSNASAQAGADIPSAEGQLPWRATAFEAERDHPPPIPSSKMEPSRHSPRRPRTLASWQVKMAMDMLAARLADPVAIAEIAEACRLSPGYFIRAFTDTVGVAPYAWLIEQRVARAISIMGAGTTPLAQIAVECGFSDQSHMTKIFAGRTGITPARCRTQQREGCLPLDPWQSCFACRRGSEMFVTSGFP